MTPHYSMFGKAWWADEGAEAQRVYSLVESVTNMQGWRASNAMRYAALYGNWDMFSQASTCYGRVPSDLRYGRLNFNMVQSCVDTVVAKHAANQPRIEVLTENAEFFRTHQVDYRGGARYPHLVRDPAKPDTLAEVLKARR